MMFARRKKIPATTSSDSSDSSDSGRDGYHHHEESISQHGCDDGDEAEEVVGRIPYSVSVGMMMLDSNGYRCLDDPKRKSGQPRNVTFIGLLLLALLLGIVIAYLFSNSQDYLYHEPVTGDQTTEKLLSKGASIGIETGTFGPEEATHTAVVPSGDNDDKENLSYNPSNEEHRDDSSSYDDDYCVWSPSDQNDCRKLMAHRIGKKLGPKSKKRWLFFGDSTVAQFWHISSLDNNLVDLASMKWNERDRINNQERDSSNNCANISMTNSSSYHCEAKRIHQHCDLNEPFGLPRPDVWQLPNVSLGEGPLMIVAAGAATTTLENKKTMTTLSDVSNTKVSDQLPERNATCLGCRNCQSSFLSCHIMMQNQYQQQPVVSESQPSTTPCIPATIRQKEVQQLSLHGGYFAMPFTRDVVIQTPEARTTQENIVSYIQRQQLENQPALCVVRVGLHDMALPNMTVSKFVTNVQWYLNLLLFSNGAAPPTTPNNNNNNKNKNFGVCFHVIWLQNTAPQWKDDNDIPPGSPPHQLQTAQRVRDYDTAVRDMISTSSTSSVVTDGRRLQDYVTTIDVFAASKNWTHSDNIHMDSAWNRALGMFFLKAATKMAAPAG